MKRFLAASLAILLGAVVALADFVTTSNPVHPSGTRATIDLPVDQHMRNIGGSDGAGLCVGTSNEVAGHWQSIPELNGFQAWLKLRPGGSYPEMLAADLKKFCNSKGVAVPSHIQHTGGDIEFLRLAFATRRAVSMTYAGYDTFYGNQMIAHMVTGAHLDGTLGAVIDNNEPSRWRWMSDTQLINRWLGKTDDGRNLRVGGGWAVVWLNSPPPPVDTTAKDYLPERPLVVQEPDPYDANEGVTPGEPIQLAEPLNLNADKVFPNGYDPDMLKPKMQYWIDGESVDRPKALEYLKRFASEFSDDSKRPFVSVVSDDPAVSAIVKEAAAPYADKIHVQVFKTSSWIARDRVKSKVVAQLSAVGGGKTVYKADAINKETVTAACKAALGIVDPPAVPVMPEPSRPNLPDDKVGPPDAQPAPSPSTKIPLWLLAVGGFLIYWFFVKRS